MEYINYTGPEYIQAIKAATIRPIVKVELLNEYEQPYSDITEEISNSGGNISSQFQQGIRNSISFQIFDPTGEWIPNPNSSKFWINRKIKVYCGIATEHFRTEVNSLGQKKYQQDLFLFSKGIYILTGISGSNTPEGGKIISLQGVDKYGAFTNDTGYGEMIGTFSFERGQEISWIIRQILNQDIGNGFKLDPTEPIIDPLYVGKKLSLNLSKGPGAYLGDLLNDLATTLKADIFYDMEGHLNIWHTMDGTAYKNVQNQWDFSIGQNDFFSININYDLNKVANYIYVVGDNPSGKKLPQAIAQNNSPQSPLSIQKIGRKSRYIEKSTIYSEQEAKDYANYVLKTHCFFGSSINFECSIFPHLEVNNTFTLTDPYFNFDRESFIIISMTYPIGVGTMSISGTNIRELPML